MEERDRRLSYLSACKNTWRDDWRLMGQEGYLTGKHLQHRRFSRKLCYEDYDQCDFCWSCFDKDDSVPARAYFVPEERLWICEDCFGFFQKHFQWDVEEINDQFVAVPNTRWTLSINVLQILMFQNSQQVSPL